MKTLTHLKRLGMLVALSNSLSALSTPQIQAAFGTIHSEDKSIFMSCTKEGMITCQEYQFFLKKREESISVRRCNEPNNV